MSNNGQSKKGHIRVHADLLLHYPEFAKALQEKGFVLYSTPRRMLSWGYELPNNTIIQFEVDTRVESDDDQTDPEYDV